MIDGLKNILNGLKAKYRFEGAFSNRYLKYYFFPGGRLSRVAYLRWFTIPGILMTIILLAVLNAGLPERAFHDPVLLAVSIQGFVLRWSAFLALFLWMGWCGASKRFHDRGLTSKWLPVPLLLIVPLHLLSQRWPWFSAPFQIGHLPIPLTIMIFLGASLGIFFWLCLNLHFLPGTKGANKHGTNPLEIPNAHTRSYARAFPDHGRGHPCQMECERG